MTTQTMEPKTSTTVFRKLFDSGFHNDFKTMAETIADDCEWVLMPDMRATPEWGAFEYINRGIITKETVEFAKTTGWQFPADASTLVGKPYAVAVSFIYQINKEGKISHLREYLDMAGLMKQFKPADNLVVHDS